MSEMFKINYQMIQSGGETNMKSLLYFIRNEFIIIFRGYEHLPVFITAGCAGVLFFGC